MNTQPVRLVSWPVGPINDAIEEVFDFIPPNFHPAAAVCAVVDWRRLPAQQTEDETKCVDATNPLRWRYMVSFRGRGMIPVYAVHPEKFLALPAVVVPVTSWTAGSATLATPESVVELCDVRESSPSATSPRMTM